MPLKAELGHLDINSLSSWPCLYVGIVISRAGSIKKHDLITGTPIYIRKTCLEAAMLG